MKLKTHLKIKGEPVYIVINNEVLKDCYNRNSDGYIYFEKEENIIYLPTKKHIKVKWLIKHEYYHLLEKHFIHKGDITKYHKVICDSKGDSKELFWNTSEINACLYANEIYKKGKNYYLRQHVHKEMDQLRKKINSEYLKLKKEKDIDI